MKSVYKKYTLYFYDEDAAMYESLLAAAKSQRMSLQAYVMNILEDHAKGVKIQAPQIKEKPEIKMKITDLWEN